MCMWFVSFEPVHAFASLLGRFSEVSSCISFVLFKAVKYNSEGIGEKPVRNCWMRQPFCIQPSNEDVSNESKNRGKGRGSCKQNLAERTERPLHLQADCIMELTHCIPKRAKFVPYGLHNIY